MIINSQNLALLTQAVNAAFMAGAAQLQAGAAEWNLVGMEIPSGTAENVYPFLKSMGYIREWIGDRVIQNLAQGDFKIANKDFEETHGIPRKAVEDDQVGMYSTIFQQLGQNVRTFPGKKVYELLKAGFTTLGPDGQYFFDTDHPVGKPGAEASVSNFMGGSGEGWYIVDASKVVKPVIWQPRKSFNLVTMFDETDQRVFFQKEYVYGVDGRAGVGFSPFWQLAFASKNSLTATEVRTMLTAMASQKDDNGNPLGVQGTHLVCSPALQETANDIFSKDMLSGGESNTLKGRLKVVSTPWLL
jgi:phage major head subunit gpT-like protein